MKIAYKSGKKDGEEKFLAFKKTSFLLRYFDSIGIYALVKPYSIDF